MVRYDLSRAVWRTSSYSGTNGACVEVAVVPTWQTSTHSRQNGNCVEVAGLTGDRIKVRDSKHPRGPVLNFTPAEWDAFIGGVHNGEFDRKPRIQKPLTREK